MRPNDASQSNFAPSAPAGGSDAPDGWINLDEVAASDAPADRHADLDRTHSPRPGDRKAAEAHPRASRRCGSASSAAAEGGEGAGREGAEDEESRKRDVSRLATQTYTVSHLIFFSLLGTLARLGLTALTLYPGAPVIFSTVWANTGGSIIMGFLAEDRKLFRHEWRTSARDAKHDGDESSSSPNGSPDVDVDVAAAKRAHLAVKKMIPLYVGLATGFCGSFTSFSALVRDLFLATSNDMATPGFGTQAPARGGGQSLMAVLAVFVVSAALSLTGWVLGAHLAVACERLTPSLSFAATRRVIDPLCALLGWACWLGAVLLTVFPPHGSWRGRATLSLVLVPLGFLARFYLALRLNGRLPAFLLGTFAANVVGTAVLGMAWDLAHAPAGPADDAVSCQILQGVEDGFCGCLTTVSTWVAELTSLRRGHAYAYGAASVVVSYALMVAVMGGLRWTDGFGPLNCP